MTEHTLTAILPCRNLEISARFYARLGLQPVAKHDGYWLLSDGHGAGLHLRQTVEANPDPAHNPFGLYLYVDDVDTLAASFTGEIIGTVGDKPWRMYEFAVSDPDGTLVRVGRRSTPQVAARTVTDVK